MLLAPKLVEGLHQLMQLSREHLRGSFYVRQFKLLGLVPVNAPPSAKGKLDITYVDEDLRISRGDRGALPCSCIAPGLVSLGLACPGSACSVLHAHKLSGNSLDVIQESVAACWLLHWPAHHVHCNDAGNLFILEMVDPDAKP